MEFKLHLFTVEKYVIPPITPALLGPHYSEKGGCIFSITGFPTLTYLALHWQTQLGVPEPAKTYAGSMPVSQVVNLQSQV